MNVSLNVIVICVIIFLKVVDGKIYYFLYIFVFLCVLVNKRFVYEEVKKVVEKDRLLVKVLELFRYGFMEIIRKRV